jgi:hypothetical protein
MLRDCGVIGDWVATKYGKVLYFEKDVELGRPVLLRNVWFDYAKVLLPRWGMKCPARMGDIPKAKRDQIKGLVDVWAREKAFVGQKLLRREVNGRVVFFRNNHQFGMLDKHHHVEGDIEPKFAASWDGNLCILA